MGGAGRRRLGRRTGFLVALIAAVVATVGVAAAEEPGEPAGKPVGFLNGYLSPQVLSKTKPAPVRLHLSANFAAAERPPALTELRLLIDRNVRAGLKEVPTVEEIPGCATGFGPRRGLGAIRRECRAAVVGEGRLDVDVRFPGQPSIPVGSELIVLNGRVEGGVTTLYVHAYFSAPISGSIVFTWKVEKTGKGRYGLEAVATAPKIAGGAGSITSFRLSIKRGILAATCRDGRLALHGTARFADGSRRVDKVLSACTPRT